MQSVCEKYNMLSVAIQKLDTAESVKDIKKMLPKVSEMNIEDLRNKQTFAGVCGDYSFDYCAYPT